MSDFVYDNLMLPANAATPEIMAAINSLREAILKGAYHGIGTGPSPALENGVTRLRQTSDRLQAAIGQSAYHTIAERSPGTFNVRDFGAIGDGVTDDLKAFTAAIEAMTDLPGQQGRVLFIPPGKYRLSGTLRVNRACIIQGSGTNYHAATTLFVDPGVHGIELVRKDSEPKLGRADNAEIRDLAIIAKGKTAEAHGLVAHTSFHLVNISISGFMGNGIHAQAAYQQGTNANCWYIDRCTIAACGGHGLFLDGGDANAGVAIGLACRDNVGWGIYDSSFLGNTFVACIAEANKAGPYRTDNANQRSLFIGCYSESGQPPSIIQSPSMVVGGLHGAKFDESANGFLLNGEGFHTITGFATPLTVQTAGGPQKAYVRLNAGPGNFLAFLRPEINPGIGLFIRYWNPVQPLPCQGEWVGFNYANLDAGWSFLIPTSPDGAKVRTYQNGNVTVDKPAGMAPAFSQGGFRWGVKAGWHGISDGPPKTGTWEETDVLHNRLANSPNNEWGGWIGAICTAGGTAGTYAEGLTATADGTNVIVLNGPTTKLAVGQYIVVSNITTQIASVDVAKIKLTLTTTVPPGNAISIAYKAPSWRRFGKLE